jgi:hypothetical protein
VFSLQQQLLDVIVKQLLRLLLGNTQPRSVPIPPRSAINAFKAIFKLFLPPHYFDCLVPDLVTLVELMHPVAEKLMSRFHCSES